MNLNPEIMEWFYKTYNNKLEGNYKAERWYWFYMLLIVTVLILALMFSLRKTFISTSALLILGPSIACWILLLVRFIRAYRTEVRFRKFLLKREILDRMRGNGKV